MSNQFSLLDTRDAARFCNISTARISDLLRKRFFPPPTIRNSKAYFYKDECELWLADQQNAKAAA